MGSYKKKRYKKKSIDLFHEPEIIEELHSEIDFYTHYEEEILDDEILPIEETIMEEPEIVTQLREEERSGKFPLWIPSLQEESTKILETLYEIKHIQTHMKTDESEPERKNYEETLDLARKTFQKVKNETIESINFTDEEQ